MVKQLRIGRTDKATIPYVLTSLQVSSEIYTIIFSQMGKEQLVAARFLLKHKLKMENLNVESHLKKVANLVYDYLQKLSLMDWLFHQIQERALMHQF